MNIILRPATPNDTQALVALTRELAIYEKKNPADIKLTAEKIMAHGFNSQPYFHILVTEYEQELIGHALYFFTYAASLGAPILYLEDLFVRDGYRKNGIGTQMLAELAKIAVKKDCCRMEWHAFTWNEAAIAFYKSLGGTLKTDLVQVRLDSAATQKLAALERKIESD